MLGQLLGALGQHSPSFAEYAGGAQYPNRYAGMGDVSGLLGAMSQPGAFTSTRSTTGTGYNFAPSDFSNLMSLLGIGGALGLGAYNSGLFGSVVDNILKPLGGLLHITGPSENQPTDTSSIQGILGDQAPGSSLSDILGGSQAGLNLNQDPLAGLDPSLLNLGGSAFSF